MSPHEAAQGVAWFAVLIFAFIGVVLWHDYRRETKDIPSQSRIVQPRRVK